MLFAVIDQTKLLLDALLLRWDKCLLPKATNHISARLDVEYVSLIAQGPSLTTQIHPVI